LYIKGVSYGGFEPLGRGVVCSDEVAAEVSGSGVELVPVTEEASVSSGIVANFCRTCLRAGRLIGLLQILSAGKFLGRDGRRGKTGGGGGWMG
jgi:hypothetical protein